MLPFVSPVIVFKKRYVLDGWPVTKSQVDLLSRYRIVPVRVVELRVSDGEVLRRGDCDRTSASRCVVVCYLLALVGVW